MSAKKLPVCEECEHRFDPKDPRGKAADTWARCPLCTMMTLRSAEAWALTNDCNGIFDDTVRGRKAEVQAILDQSSWADTGCRVVPVRIVAEPEDRHDQREFEERQWVKAWG